MKQIAIFKYLACVLQKDGGGLIYRDFGTVHMFTWRGAVLIAFP